MKLLIGLGNPALRPLGLARGGQAQGKDKYSGTRHNLGFMVVDELAKKLGGTWETDNKLKSYILRSAQDDILLAKPQTYMNNSGQAVKLLTTYYKIPITDVIVVHDDLDILLGKVKVRQGGAAAGHHGVESIIDAIGDGFWRVRVGIGNEQSHSGEHKRIAFNAEKFVLEPFTPSEKSHVKHGIKQAVEEISRLVVSFT